MPGNKNSGRRKKPIDVGKETDNPPDSTSVVRKRTVGRPKKTTNAAAEYDESDPLPEPLEDQPGKTKADDVVIRVGNHAVDLAKRSSCMSKFYDEFLGPPLEVFPSSKLPLKRVVLQRYRTLRSLSHATPQTEIVATITKELILLWERSAIPFKPYTSACRVILGEIMTWVNATEEDRKCENFQRNLNTLSDLRPKSLQTLSSLKSYLMSSGNPDWLRDYEFFKGQCSFPQTGTLGPRDGCLKKKLQRKSIRDAKSRAFAEKNANAPSVSLSTATATSVRRSGSSTAGMSEANILPSGSRRCAISAIAKNRELMGEEQATDADTEPAVDDNQWDLPVRAKRRLRQRPKTVTLVLPAQKLPSVMAKTSVVTRTSGRHELKIMSTLIKSGGADINDTNLSLSTIQRQRRSEISASANSICKRIIEYAVSETENDFVVLHFDGKIIQYVSGDTEDRLAIGISVPNFIKGQFLASPAMPSGKGASMANCVEETANKFHLTSKIEALVFDTTASNTGIWKGATTRVEKMLRRAVLWLACRHHIAELFVKHANIAVRGNSTAPEDPLFTKFRKTFGFIDRDTREVWVWPNHGDWRYQRASDVLTWANYHMQEGTWPREDYRELLELVGIFLGGVVKRMQYGSYNVITSPIRKPGACHRARFMASCLYILKIYFYRAQFMELTPDQVTEMSIMAEYIALIHAPYFLKSPLAISAPRQDRDLWVDLIHYRECFDETSTQAAMVTAVQKNFLTHLWYLTEELVVFGLFDNNLADHERKSMANQLLLCPRPISFAPGKPVFRTDLMTDQPTLDSFIGPRSWILFHKLNAAGTWLNREVMEWPEDNEYKRLETFLKDLKVVNDLAERCVGAVQTYRNMAKDSVHRDEILLVASDHRGVFQDLRKQALQ